MAKQNFADLKCKDTVYITPDSLLDPVRSYFGGKIPLDPATEPNNPTRAEVYCVAPTEEPAALNQLALVADGTTQLLVDGLQVSWSDYDGVFVNPPYSKIIRQWLAKLHEEAEWGAEIVALLPCGARYSTVYWQRDVFTDYLDAICFVKGRVKFLRPDGTPTTGSNPYDSQIMLFNGQVDRFIELFQHLGKVLVVDVR